MPNSPTPAVPKYAKSQSDTVIRQPALLKRLGVIFLHCTSFVTGLITLVASFIVIEFGSCDGEGVFCAGPNNTHLYVYGLLAAFAGGTLQAVAFTRNLIKLLASGAVVSGIALLWIVVLATTA